MPRILWYARMLRDSPKEWPYPDTMAILLQYCSLFSSILWINTPCTSVQGVFSLYSIWLASSGKISMLRFKMPFKWAMRMP